MKSLYFCGAGNSEGIRLAQTINREEQRWSEMFVLDDDASRHGTKLLGCEIIGGFDVLADVDPETSEVVNLVARQTRGRSAARKKIASYGVPFTRLVSPNVDTYGAEVAHDAIVYHNATIGPETVVGEGSVVFMGAVVGHEAIVGKSCVMAANSVLNARVELGEGVYVGTNATILPETKVGAFATIGAGSVVLEDVPAGATVIGVPGEVLSSPAANRAATEEPEVQIDHELEKTICKIWQDVLAVPVVEVGHNFFDVGGSSLLAVRMRDHLHEETGNKISLTDVFRFPTVRSLAAHVVSNRGNAAPPKAAPSRAAIRREFHARWRKTH
ncbi:MAG: phosphopantetheine-binding protein [Myxococcota bacterium]|jgi:sugar O-acyltransferase (sialic acid O-acetyltransferase NeuD family)|nr:phosphopantetheine-binding protein [Myxococcota bacterium]